MKHLWTHLQMCEVDCCQWICRNVQRKTLVLHVFAMATCCLVAGSKAACTKEGSKWWTIAVADRRTWLWTCYLTSMQNQRCNLGGPFSIVPPKKDGGFRVQWVGFGKKFNRITWIFKMLHSQTATSYPGHFKGHYITNPNFMHCFFGKSFKIIIDLYQIWFPQRWVIYQWPKMWEAKIGHLYFLASLLRALQASTGPAPAMACLAQNDVFVGVWLEFARSTFQNAFKCLPALVCL